ncbi:hypothetical protein C8R44DRAFT_877866 [Mycena epipterygia]|nr:hypothetical protein C8R44DRAFT_877866 [Mycena epipterygia]
MARPSVGKKQAIPDRADSEATLDLERTAAFSMNEIERLSVDFTRQMEEKIEAQEISLRRELTERHESLITAVAAFGLALFSMVVYTMLYKK